MQILGLPYAFTTSPIPAYSQAPVSTRIMWRACLAGPGATPRISDSVCLECWGLRTCISNKFQVIFMLLVWQVYFRTRVLEESSLGQSLWVISPYWAMFKVKDRWKANIFFLSALTFSCKKFLDPIRTQENNTVLIKKWLVQLWLGSSIQTLRQLNPLCRTAKRSLGMS